MITTSDSVENAYLLHSDVILQIQARWIARLALLKAHYRNAPNCFGFVFKNRQMSVRAQSRAPRTLVERQLANVRAVANSRCGRVATDVSRQLSELSLFLFTSIRDTVS
jgi:hypothetical protein